MRVAFLGLTLLNIFFRLLPMDTVPRAWAPPDLMIALACAWSVRRPDFVPTLLLAGCMLLADLLFHRPPGLLAMLVVLGCEYLKTRSLPHREGSFASEWLTVALVLTGITVLNRLILFVLAVDQAPLGLILIQMLLTIAVYPVIVVISQSILGVRRLTQADAEAMGARL